MSLDLNNSKTLKILVIVVIILFTIIYICINKNELEKEEFANYPVAVDDVVQLKGGLNNVQVGNDNTPLSTTLNNLIQQGINNIVPPFSVVSYYGTVAPIGWQMCDGKNLRDTTNKFVYDIDGNPISTPNLQGRVIVGTTINTNSPLVDQNGKALGTYNLGSFNGEENHVLTTAEMPSHNHTYSYSGLGCGGSFCSGGGNGNPGINTGLGYSNPINNTLITINNTGGNKAHNIMQPYFTLTYIIKQLLPNTPPIKK